MNKPKKPRKKAVYYIDSVQQLEMQLEDARTMLAVSEQNLVFERREVAHREDLALKQGREQAASELEKVASFRREAARRSGHEGDVVGELYALREAALLVKAAERIRNPIVPISDAETQVKP